MKRLLQALGITTLVIAILCIVFYITLWMVMLGPAYYLTFVGIFSVAVIFIFVYLGLE